jgi:hypothetical protein
MSCAAVVSVSSGKTTSIFGVITSRIFMDVLPSRLASGRLVWRRTYAGAAWVPPV